MKLLKFLLTILIPVAFASCQKGVSSGDPGNPVSSLSKIRTYTEDITSSSGHEVMTFNLTYDASDKLVSMASVTSPGDRFDYHYSNDSYTLDIYSSNLLTIHETFFVNSNLLVDSTFQYNDTNDSSTEKYSYNNAGQLVSVRDYDYSLITGTNLSNIENYVYDGNNNITKLTDNSSVTTYEYYTNLANNLVFGPPGRPLSKNLVKTTVVNSGGDITTLNHTYTFDSRNRITSEKITADNGDIAVKSYTYY